MDSAIELTFRYEEIDYVRAARAHFGTRRRIWIDVGLSVLGLVPGIYWWRSSALHWFGVFLVASAIVFLLVLFAGLNVFPRIVFRREPKFRDEYNVVFSPEHIHFRTAHIDSRLEWSLYSRAVVDSYSFVLYHGVRSFTVIPTRVFRSAEQRELFERLLAAHISKVVWRDNRV